MNAIALKKCSVVIFEMMNDYYFWSWDGEKTSGFQPSNQCFLIECRFICGVYMGFFILKWGRKYLSYFYVEPTKIKTNASS